MMTKEDALGQLRGMAEAMAWKAGADIFLTLRDTLPNGVERDWLTAQALAWNHRGTAALEAPQSDPTALDAWRESAADSRRKP